MLGVLSVLFWRSATSFMLLCPQLGSIIPRKLIAGPRSHAVWKRFASKWRQPRSTGIITTFFSLTETFNSPREHAPSA